MTEVSIPLEFVLFGLTLIGVAVFHHQTLAVSLTGLTEEPQNDFASCAAIRKGEAAW